MFCKLTTNLKLRSKVAAPPFDKPSDDSRMRLGQLRTITAAYKSLSQTEPTLPSADSPLPALLAVRNALNLVEQSKQTIRETRERLSKAETDLRRENESLKDAEYLSSALEARAQLLRQEEEEQSQRSKDDIVEGLMQAQQRRKSHYAKELRGLVRALNKFINEHLAVMLAAEELGGPVVGDAFHLDEDALIAGFTQQGKAKKMLAGDSKFDAKRRQRNKEIWGGEDEENVDGEPLSEKEAEAAGFRNLTERLLNAAVSDDNSTPYISIPRETAAVRFLVRAKVAMFHPEDARKLRLLDFGADLNE